MEFYLKEAFQSLKLLEDDFNLTADQGVIDELQSFVADDIEAPAEEEIIDVEADEVEDLQDNYIGKVILECDCCHTRIYKDIKDVIIDDDTGLANIEEQCPVCSNAFGWNVIGKIEPFKEGEFDDEPEDAEEVGDAEENVPEISDDEIGEALKEALNENLEPEEQKELDGIVYNHLADAAYEAEVDHELEATRSDMEKAERAFNDNFYMGSVEEDVDVHVDQPEDNDDVVVNVDADDELHEDVESDNSKLLLSADEYKNWHDVKMFKSEDSDKYLVTFNRSGSRDVGPLHPNTDEFYDVIPDYKLLDYDEANAIYKEILGKSLTEDFENPADVGINPETASEHAEILEEPMENPVTEIPDKLVVNESVLTEDANSVKNLVVSYLQDSLVDFNDNLAYTVHDAIPEYDVDWCDDDGMSELADRANMTQDEYIDAIANLLFAHAPTQESLDEDVEDVQSEDAEKLVDPEEEPVKDLKEDLNEVEVHTDEQDIEVKTEDGKVVVEVGNPEQAEAPVEDEMIAPLDAEEINDIENNEEQSAEEAAIDDELGDEADDEFAIDDFDEESFDEIGESYLRRVYDNVDSFNTTKVVSNNDKLIIEGVIKFKSGKTKNSSFVFEGFRTTKRGKTLAEGMNETFSKSKKAFILKGTLTNKNFVSESLTYNYTVKSLNESNQSEAIRVYGRAVRK